MKKTGGENKLNPVSKARKISKFFTVDCQVDLQYEGGTITGRDVLAGSVI